MHFVNIFRIAHLSVGVGVTYKIISIFQVLSTWYQNTFDIILSAFVFDLNFY